MHMGTLKFVAPGRLIILHPLKPTFFRLLRPSTGLVSAQIVDNFKEILLHVETWVYQHHISDYSSDVLVALIVWCPRLSLSPVLAPNPGSRQHYRNWLVQFGTVDPQILYVKNEILFHVHDYILTKQQWKMCAICQNPLNKQCAQYCVI